MDSEKQKTYSKAFLLLGVLLLMIIPFTSAGLVTPATDGTATGTSFLNATNSSGEFIAATSCTFWAISTSTANSTWSNLTSTTNSSGGATTSFYINYDSTILEDSNDYSFLAECENATASYNSTTNTGITIDNTVPTAATIVSPTSGSTDEDGTVTFEGTVVGGETTACSLHFPNRNPGAKTYTMTHTGSSCTYTTTTTMADETYEYIIEASDGTNRTNSTQTSFNVDVQTSGGGDGTIPGPVDSQDKQGVPLGTIVVLGVAALVLWRILSRK